MSDNVSSNLSEAEVYRVVLSLDTNDELTDANEITGDYSSHLLYKNDTGSIEEFIIDNKSPVNKKTVFNDYFKYEGKEEVVIRNHGGSIISEETGIPKLNYPYTEIFVETNEGKYKWFEGDDTIMRVEDN